MAGGTADEPAELDLDGVSGTLRFCDGSYSVAVTATADSNDIVVESLDGARRTRLTGYATLVSLGSSGSVTVRGLTLSVDGGTARTPILLVDGATDEVVLDDLRIFDPEATYARDAFELAPTGSEPIAVELRDVYIGTSRGGGSADLSSAGGSVAVTGIEALTGQTLTLAGGGTASTTVEITASDAWITVLDAAVSVTDAAAYLRTWDSDVVAWDLSNAWLQVHGGSLDGWNLVGSWVSAEDDAEVSLDHLENSGVDLEDTTFVLTDLSFDSGAPSVVIRSSSGTVDELTIDGGDGGEIGLWSSVVDLDDVAITSGAGVDNVITMDTSTVTITAGVLDGDGGLAEIILGDEVDLTLVDTVVQDSVADGSTAALYGGDFFGDNRITCVKTGAEPAGFYRNTALSGFRTAVRIDSSTELISEGCDWGTGIDDNSPVDLICRDLTVWAFLSFGDDENFTCTGCECADD